MGVSFNKNGIIRGGVVADSSSYSLCNVSIGYTPTKGANNSCMEYRVSDMIENHNYVIAATLSWYFASFPDNFAFSLQGIQHRKTDVDWGWTNASQATDALMAAIGSTDHRLTAFAKSNPNYAKRIIAEFTVQANYDGYAVGCRCNYADGNSWVKMSDVIIVPKEYWVGDMKLYSDEIIANNFIEC